MRRQFVSGLMAAVVLVVSQGCGSSPTSPSLSTNTSNPAPTPAPTVAVAGVKVSGTASFAAVGEASQFTAVATFSDGTAKDVTSEAQWRSTDPAVAEVSPAGVVTVVSLGRSIIQAQYLSKLGQLQIVANSPGTFVAFGRVREPGQGGINGVRVLDPKSGRSTLTSNSGEVGSFSIGGLTNNRLMFDKETYESREYEVQPNVQADVALQRIIRLTAGGTVTPADLAPHDMSYTVGADRCEPCRLIRVYVPSAGTLRLNLKWTEARATLNLWAEGRTFPATNPELTVDLPVGAGELVVYVGSLFSTSGTVPTYYVRFTLATTLQ